MGTNRSTTEDIDVHCDAVDEVVCLSDDGNPTTPTQAYVLFIYGKACGFGVIQVGAKKDGNTNVKRWQYWHCECGPGTSTNQVVKEVTPKGLKYNRVELTHKNHVPTPSKSRFIPSYRDVPKFVLRVAKDLIDAGVKTTKIKSTLMVERFFQKIYTDAKFKEVQTECLALIYVLPGTEVQLSETVTEYTLVERIQVGDPIRHVTRGLKVTVDMEKLEFTCSCRMFEHKGILCRHCIRAMEMTNIDKLEQLRLRTGSENGQDDFVVSTQGSNDATQTDYHEQQNAWDGVENPPPGKRIGRPPSKTPYGFPQQKKSKGSTRSKGSTEGSVTKPAPQRTHLMEQCMNSFYNTLSQTSSLGYQVPLQFDVHRPPRPDFRWAINEQQQSQLQVHPQLNGFTEHVAGCYSNSTSFGHDYRGFQGSSTAISSAASSAFRPLHPGSFTNWWTYGVGGTSATGSSSPFAPPLPQFGSGSTTMHGVSTASNGQPTLLPQLHPRAVTSFLPPRPC
ncbi:Protein FAR1-RELATED SEQUENCE 2 [Bienertia sinuspersici]